MGDLSGYLTAKLAEKTEIYDGGLIEEINRSIQPPRPVGAGDVHIRAMYIVSDQVNGQGGRFADEELDRLTTLLVDSPVMVGHQRDSLPVARTFKAVRVVDDDRTWIKSYFYWMKNSEGAEDLRNNIDGGIYKECSISFLFEFPECSVCGQDIRKCRHVPFEEYEDESGQKAIAHFTYRNIIRVLETSLVFRGAVPDTKITDRLDSDGAGNRILETVLTATHFFKANPFPNSPDEATGYSGASVRFHPAASSVPDAVNPSSVIVPYQPGCVMRFVKRDQNLELQSQPSLPEKSRLYIVEALSKLKVSNLTADVLLFAVKGNERQNGFGLLQLFDSDGGLHRLRLRLCDLLEVDGESFVHVPYRERIKKLEAVIGEADDERPGARLSCIRYTDGWNSERLAEECANYRFGLEVITDEGAGRLARHILTVRPLTPVSIRSATMVNHRHVRCTVQPLGQPAPAVAVVCPRAVGVEENAVILVDSEELASKNKNHITPLVDIIPGRTARLVVSSGPAISPTEAALHMGQGDDCLRLMFRHEAAWQIATIHHFSPRLFARGRRFIADSEESADYPIGPAGGESTLLETITRMGRLTHIRICELHSLFGQSRDLWLRPVLIDGRERFLFYGSGPSGLPEEL